jgi:hypothetical protein
METTSLTTVDTDHDVVAAVAAPMPRPQPEKRQMANVKDGGVLNVYTCVMSPHNAYPISGFSVSTVKPSAEYDCSVRIAFIELHTSDTKSLRVYPTNGQYATVEVAGKVVYDSRADIPCNMTLFNSSRTRFDDHTEMTAVVNLAIPSTDYREAAITLWGDAGSYVHAAYARWLPLFPELPESLPIVMGITAYGKCIGLTRAGWEHGPRITIASNLFKQGRLMVDDVMVHEMLHAWLYITGQDTAHESPAWYSAIKRLSPVVLGHDLDVRRGAQRKSVRVKLDDGRSVVRKEKVPEFAGQHDRVSRWPSPFRPIEFDYGQPITCPSY